MPTPQPTIIAGKDSCETPQNDPNAVPGKTWDPYGDPCQSGFYRAWHIAWNWWGLGVAAPTFADIPAPETRPLWMDHVTLGKTAAALGFAYSWIAVWDGSVDVVSTAASTIDPDIGYKIDPWSAASFLEDMPIAKIFQQKTGIQMVCHTQRQFEIVKLAMAYGTRAKSIKDIPLCPPLLSDCTHYWVGASQIAWENTHSSFLKTVKGKFLYLFVDSAGRPDLKNIAWMVTLVLGTAQASNGTVSTILKAIGINI